MRIDSYYIRRPGPQSETPRTGADWERLVRRCTLNDRDLLLDQIRQLLGPDLAGRVQAEPSAIERVDAWAELALARWAKLATDQGVTELYKHGVATYAYLIGGISKRPSQHELVQVLERAKGPETGWPMWLILHSDETGRPRPFEGGIEAFLAGGTVFNDPSHADYWRATTDGRFFLLRGFEEDGDVGHSQPGAVFDFLLPVWRASEALLHASRTARELEVPEAPITLRASWIGLRGRTLQSLWGRRYLRTRAASENEVVSRVEVAADEIASNLPAILLQLLAPLYAVFDFFEMRRNILEEEVQTFRSRRSR